MMSPLQRAKKKLAENVGIAQKVGELVTPRGTECAPCLYLPGEKPRKHAQFSTAPPVTDPVRADSARAESSCDTFYSLMA